METPMRRANDQRHLIDLIHIGAFHAIGMECLLRHVGATGPQFMNAKLGNVTILVIDGNSV